MIKALLFDLYDTLALIDAKLYLEVKENMAQMAGLSADNFIRVWKNYTKVCALGKILTIEERVAHVIRELNILPESSLVRDIAFLEYKLQTENVYLTENVIEVLSYFKSRDFQIGLVTNAPSYLRTVPSILGIEKLFDTIIYSYDIGALKPDSLIYLSACKNLEVNPAECIFIGDGNDNELDGANNLGIITVKIGKGRSKLLQSSQSKNYNYRILKLKELIYVVDQISASS